MRVSLIGLLILTLVVGTAAGAGLRIPDYQTTTLDNGLVVQLMPHSTVPMVSIELWIRAGAADDPDGLEGLASLTADALRKGAGDRSAAEFAQTLDFLGADFGTSVDTERTRVRLNLQSRDFELALDLLRDLLLRPRLVDAEIEKLRDQAAEGVKQAKENPRNVLGRYHAAHLFGDHPYGRPVGGTEESLPRISPDDVRRFHRDHFGADRAILTVVGDLDPATAQEQIASRFGGWGRAAAEPTAIGEPHVADGPRVLLVNKNDTPQTWFMIGSVGPSWQDLDDFAATELVRTVFGGRFTSWLNRKLRVEEGLTYGARYGITRFGESGSARISTFTATETTQRAIDLALAQLDRLHEEGLGEADLESAKAYVRGQMPYRYETAGDLAVAISRLAFHGIDRSHLDRLFDAIDRVTLDDCRAAVEKWFARENLVFTAIGVAEEIEPVLESYGPVTVRENTDVGFAPVPSTARSR